MTENYAVHLLTAEQITYYWMHIDQVLNQIPEEWAPFWTKEEISKNLQNGTWQLWSLADESIIHVMIMTSVFEGLDKRRSLNINLAFGKGIRKYLPMAQDMFLTIARKLDCKKVEFTGRKGWVELLKPIGFRVTSVNMVLDVDDEVIH